MNRYDGIPEVTPAEIEHRKRIAETKAGKLAMHSAAPPAITEQPQEAPQEREERGIARDTLAEVDATPKINPPVGEKPIITWVAIEALQIDDAYQRSLESSVSEKLISEIAENWNWSLCAILTVALRNETELFVVDGQHRLTGARRRGDIQQLPCIVIPSEGQTDEAKLFVAVNGQRRNPTPLDRFHAKVVMGDEEAVAINNIVISAGLVVGKSTQKIRKNEICCVAVLRRMLRTYGDDHLRLALHVMVAAWPYQPMNCANELLPGICLFLLDESDDGTDYLDRLAVILGGKEQSDWTLDGLKRRSTHIEDQWPDEIVRDLILMHALEAA